MRIDKFFEGQPFDQAAHGGQRGGGRRRITVNGRPVKASYAVKEGDVIEVAFGGIDIRIGWCPPKRPRAKTSRARCTR